MRVCVGELVGAIVYAYIGGVVCVYKHTVTTAGFASTLSSLPPPPPPPLLLLLLLLPLLLFHCIYRDIFCSSTLLSLSIPLLWLILPQCYTFLLLLLPLLPAFFIPLFFPFGPPSL